MLSNDEAQVFYGDKYWRRLRNEVIKDDKYECQIHKARGQYRKANTVHHVKHLKEYPELAMERFYVDDKGVKQRQLLSVCKHCHETVCHPEWMLSMKEREEPLTKERWD